MISRSLRVKRFVTGLQTAVSSVAVRAYLRFRGASVGQGLRARSFPVCRRYGNGRLEIGRNFSVNNTLRENLAGVVHKTVLYVEHGCRLRIGDDVGISGAILHAQADLIIGDRCLLGANCSIYTSDFHGVQPAERMVSGAIRKAPVVLEDDVWIGANSLILKGVTVGRGSVVGAGSVVTKSIPAGVIAAGNPARVVRELPAAPTADRR